MRKQSELGIFQGTAEYKVIVEVTPVVHFIYNLRSSYITTLFSYLNNQRVQISNFFQAYKDLKSIHILCYLQTRDPSAFLFCSTLVWC